MITSEIFAYGCACVCLNLENIWQKALILYSQCEVSMRVLNQSLHWLTQGGFPSAL